MKRLIFVIAMFAPAMAAHGLTHITSDIATPAVWTSAGSPYVIQADVAVIGDDVLTIQAGVTVAFDGDYILRTGWGSSIYAVGDPGNPILFTSNATTPAPGDYNWLQPAGPATSTFAHCVFEYGEYGIRPNVTDTVISYCTIRYCLSSGLFTAGASPTVTHCDIHHCRDGIGISSNSAPIIHNCNIHDNTNWNVYVFDFSEPSAVIDMENNWWGTDDPVAIAQEINDAVDHPDYLYATIDFDPWAGGVGNEKLSWSGVKAMFGD